MDKLQERIEAYNQKKQETPVFWFMQEVEITDWFYKGFYGRIYKELDFMMHPDQENNRDDGIVTTYTVIVYEEWKTNNKDSIIDHRLVEAIYMKAK